MKSADSDAHHDHASKTNHTETEGVGWHAAREREEDRPARAQQSERAGVSTQDRDGSNFERPSTNLDRRCVSGHLLASVPSTLSMRFEQ